MLRALSFSIGFTLCKHLIVIQSYKQSTVDILICFLLLWKNWFNMVTLNTSNNLIRQQISRIFLGETKGLLNLKADKTFYLAHFSFILSFNSKKVKARIVCKKVLMKLCIQGTETFNEVNLKSYQRILMKF